MTAVSAMSDLQRSDDVWSDCGIHVEPLSPLIGGVVHGVGLADVLADEQVLAIAAALVAHKVLFFRDQNVSRDQHVTFARRFGELEVHPFTKNLDSHPEIICLHNDADRPPRGTDLWHSDVTWRLEPSLGSILLCRECPQVGGDTLFANMEEAYERLDEDTKALINGLTAVHDFAPFRNGLLKAGKSESEVAALMEQYPLAHHPVVRTHPVSGRKSLYVNRAFTVGLEGMSEAAAKPLLEKLYVQANIPDLQCRFRWRPGSVAFWDNRAAQHYACADYYPHTRTMERVTVVGDRPI